MHILDQFSCYSIQVQFVQWWRYFILYLNGKFCILGCIWYFGWVIWWRKQLLSESKALEKCWNFDQLSIVALQPSLVLASSKCVVESSLGQRHSMLLDPPLSFRLRNLVRQQQQRLHPISATPPHSSPVLVCLSWVGSKVIFWKAHGGKVEKMRQSAGIFHTAPITMKTKNSNVDEKSVKRICFRKI